MNRAVSALRSVVRICRIVLAGLAVYAVFCALLRFPMLFGYAPVSVCASESPEYPVGTFTFCFTGDQAIPVGSAAILYTEEGAVVKIVAAADDASQTFVTGSGETLRTEYIIGTPGLLCLPGCGWLHTLFCSDGALCVLVGLSIPALVGAFYVPVQIRRAQNEVRSEMPPVELTAEYLRNVRFTPCRGGMYSTDEVDGFLQKLAEAAEEKEAEHGAVLGSRDAELLAIRTRMSEEIAEALLRAEQEAAALPPEDE